MKNIRIYLYGAVIALMSITQHSFAMDGNNNNNIPEQTSENVTEQLKLVVAGLNNILTGLNKIENIMQTQSEKNNETMKQINTLLENKLTKTNEEMKQIKKLLEDNNLETKRARQLLQAYVGSNSKNYDIRLKNMPNDFQQYS